jgi:hypothetical protein
VVRRRHRRRDAKRRRRAQNGADIVRIGNLVEHQHDAGGGQIGKRRRGQGIGRAAQPMS